MKKLILLLTILCSVTLANAQTFEMKPFAGFLLNAKSTTSSLNVSEFSDLRLALFTKSHFTKDFFLTFDVMKDFNSNNVWDFSNIDLTYSTSSKDLKFFLKAGKTASWVLRNRPYPISSDALFEYFATTEIYSKNKLVLISDIQKGDFGFGFSIGEAGHKFGDQTEYAFKANYGKFVLTTYSIKGDFEETGFIQKYNSSKFNNTFFIREGLATLAADYSPLENWILGADMIWGESKDFSELFVMRTFNFSYANIPFQGLIASGYRVQESTFNLYFMISIDISGDTGIKFLKFN